ncbi:hypothetical protein AAL_06117 [Moelleriella libera RCEF 2490]|uniref:Uncharacterized protein n=1 Tax=Moelleriella libera RCEF 2490 TaxID=1081109 RepID=A0A167ZCV7_9HYPO|nr:hypothetical protein AAL_06117 [Moelleriella libera RCEF 2490]
MSPFLWALRFVQAFEILRQPGFHRAVGRVHRTIHERRYGRNPHEPLAPGEATADPEMSGSGRGGGRGQSFFRHFVDELKNQARGRPSDLANKGPPK